MFQDRCDAGDQLARRLLKYRDEKPIVLAIPRGGVEVGVEIARSLLCDFSIVIVRKLPFPDNAESGFGAIAEDGSTWRVKHYRHAIPEETALRIQQAQQQEISRRIRVLRRGRPLPELGGRTVILTDDGIAMGSTMHAAVQLCKNHRAGKIITAVPVASPETAREFAKVTDETIVLEQPPHFFAVAQAYADWYDVSDEEVLHILERFGEFAREKRI
jgi:predicted phosphoribosyltransferase